jgi:hypothetical protein
MTNRRISDRHDLYEIRIQGLLDESWSDWFDGLTIIPQPDGATLLTGPLTDQAALHGVLNRIRDIGLPLLSVRQTESRDQEGENKY